MKLPEEKEISWRSYLCAVHFQVALLISFLEIFIKAFASFSSSRAAHTEKVKLEDLQSIFSTSCTFYTLGRSPSILGQEKDKQVQAMIDSSKGSFFVCSLQTKKEKKERPVLESFYGGGKLGNSSLPFPSPLFISPTGFLKI